MEGSIMAKVMAVVENYTVPDQDATLAPLSGNFISLAALFLCLGLVYLRGWVQAPNNRAPTPRPPGPRSWPVVGSLIQILASTRPIHETLAGLAEVYGPIMFFRLGSLPCVVVTSAEAAHLVFTHDQFSHRATNGLLWTLRYLVFDNKGFICHYNEQVKLLRRLCATEILTAPRVAALAKGRQEDVQAAIENVAIISKLGQLVCLKDALGNLGLNMMTQMLLGHRFYGSNAKVAKELRNFADILPAVLELAGTIYWADLFPALCRLDLHGRTTQYRKLRSQMEDAFQTIINEFRLKERKLRNGNGGEFENFLQILLSTQEQNQLSDTAIMATIQDLLIGGSEAVEKTTEWALAELVRNPKKMSKLKEELDILTGGARRVEESDLVNLPYLRACVREVLRLHPPLPLLIPRETETATTLNGYTIPPKTAIFVNAWQIGRDPSHYENADCFEPERFFSPGPDRGEGSSSKHFLAFGAGRRVCVGVKLGTTMTQITLASLVHAFDWAPPPGIKPSEIDLTVNSGLVLGLRNPLHLLARPRLHPRIYNSSLQ